MLLGVVSHVGREGGGGREGEGEEEGEEEGGRRVERKGEGGRESKRQFTTSVYTFMQSFKSVI